MYKEAIFTVVLIISLHFTISAQTDTVLNRYRQYLFQTEHLPDMPKLISSLNHSGYWSDIDYSNESRAEWQIMKHLQRVQEMAVAWSNPASNYFHQEKLRVAIDNALDYWLYHRFYNPNWWYNEIGVPRYMQNIIILLRRHLSKYQYTRSLEELGQYRINGTGSNLIWSAELGFFYGALTNDTAWMRHCMDTIFHEVKINTGEGIQPDYSFHMHGNRLQIYSYGKAFIEEILKLGLLCKGTTWAVPREKIDLLADFVLNGWQWMCRGINTVPGTIDRSVSRINGLHAADIRSLIPILTALCPEKADMLNAITARQDGAGRSLAGFRYYPYSDFAIYQCENFGFFLKTISTRTLPAESINGENLKGHLLNSGDGYLIHNGKEYYNLMPVWDWNKIPGITTFKGARAIVRQPFVGSVSNGRSGLTAMDYDLAGSVSIKNIRAHKIWACHNNLVVCLIAGLSSNNITGNVFTVLDQCRRQGPVIVNAPSHIVGRGDEILRNVRWLFHNNFAYIPLKPATIDLFSGTAGGTWRSINASESDSLITDSVFMPLMIHGKNLKNISGGYVLTYCPTANQTEELANKPTWKVLRNDTLCQAAQFADKTLMAAFFSPALLNVTGGCQIKVNMPCLLFLSKTKIYISNPTHKREEVKVLINQHEMNIQLPGDGTTMVRDIGLF